METRESIPSIFFLFEFPCCITDIFSHSKPVASDLVLKIFALAGLIFLEFFQIENCMFGTGRGGILTFVCFAEKLLCCDLLWSGSLLS